MANATVSVGDIKPLIPSEVVGGVAAANVTVAVGKVFRRDSNGKWVLAQANTSAGATGELGLCVATGRAETDGDALAEEALTLVLQGRVAGFTDLDETLNYYLSDNTAGVIEDAAPAVSRFLGSAENANVLYFNPVGAATS
jgi:hypothetical protein